MAEQQKFNWRLWQITASRVLCLAVALGLASAALAEPAADAVRKATKDPLASVKSVSQNSIQGAAHQYCPVFGTIPPSFAGGCSPSG